MYYLDTGSGDFKAVGWMVFLQEFLSDKRITSCFLVRLCALVYGVKNKIHSPGVNSKSKGK